MSNQPFNQERTPGDRSGGFGFNYLMLPPIAVVLVGLMMACLLSQVSIADAPASEASKSKNNGGQIASFFTPEVQYWEPKIVSWSQEMGLDPNLVATVMQIESCGDPHARSGVGAMGLFQVMPFHFASGEDPYKPNINARRGLAFLKTALDTRGGDPKLALASYNAGIGGASQPEQNWPAETIRYVYWGTGIYQDAKKGRAESARLEEWLSAGGASLCRQAAQSLGIP
jgi:soluble lytic murein transglycosylase-like protein